MAGRLLRHNTVLLGLVALGVLTRILPHLPNMTAVGAAGLVGAALFYHRRWAMWVPMLILLISDVIFGLFTPWKGFYAGQLFVYVGFLAYSAVGYFYLRKRLTLGRLMAGAIAASAIFFLLSNFGVWLAGGLYPATPAGLWTAYVAALPFWGNQLLGDLIYGGLLIAAWRLIQQWGGSWVLAPAAVE